MVITDDVDAAFGVSNQSRPLASRRNTIFNIVGGGIYVSNQSRPLASRRIIKLNTLNGVSSGFQSIASPSE